MGRGTSEETVYIGSLFEKRGTWEKEEYVKHIFAGAQRVCSETLDVGSGTRDVKYFHTDHLGSSSVITDKDGNKVNSYEYRPYGTVTRGMSDVGRGTNYLFTGKELDSTGLYFYGARYYDPEIGRFITADTIVQAPFDPQSLNRYSYCRNNPINYTDPSGHKWSWKKFWHSAVGAFLGVALAIVLGPAGLGMSLMMAGMWGGMAGGALTGGLEGGWKGALIGAGIGGITGGIGGWAAGGGHTFVIAGMFTAGAGMAAATNSWDSFAGGFVGGLCGAAVGNGIVDSKQFQSWKAGNEKLEGYGLNRPVGPSKQEQRAQESLKIDESYGKLKNTQWAKGEEGKKVITALGKAIQDDKVTFGNLNGQAAARTDPFTGRVTISRAAPDTTIPGLLAHEGTHLTYGLTPNSLGEERACFNNMFQVELETNPQGARMPTDDDLRDMYPYLK